MRFINQDTLVHAHYDYTWQRIAVRLFEKQHQQRLIAKPTEYVVLQDSGEVIPPTFELSESQAQQLMDALWDCGIRPTQGAGSAGQMAATEKHLEDMRRMAFVALKIPPEIRPIIRPQRPADF